MAREASGRDGAADAAPKLHAYNRALIIDDDTAVGATIARIARRSGYDAIVTDDPADFLAKAAQWHPRLLIVDLVMPDVDGVDLIRRLGEQGTSAAILLVSGFDARVLELAQTLGQGLGLDMAGTVRKPFRAGELAETLAALLGDAPASPERIRHGLATGAFRLVYQPKFEVASRRMVGAEALMRWKDPERGDIPPTLFIPAAEEQGLVSELTTWAIGKAVAQQAAWVRQNIAVNVAVNFSQADLETGRMHGHFTECCRRFGADPRSFTFEITESMAMRNEVVASESLSHLRLTGATISIDDFGTGYSSLVQLRRQPFSELKIDRSFVADCTNSRESRIIVKAVIDLAHNLGLTTVAEGAETEEHLALLQELGCDLVQGYALSRPVEAEQFAALAAGGSIP